MYGRLIKNINDAKDDPEKLDEIYSQFGANAPIAKKIGGSIIKHISKGVPVAQIPQYLNKEFNIPIPAAPAMPTQPGPTADPIAQAKGAEQVKQEQLKTQKLQAEMEAEEKGRAAKEKLEQDKIAHDRQMEEEKMKMDKQSMVVEQQAKAADLQMRGQEVQANQQMKLQDFEQKQQMAQVKQQADMQQQQANIRAQQQQQAMEQKQAEMQAQQGAMPQEGADPYKAASDEFLLGMQRSTPHAQGAALRWDQQRGTHIASARMGNDPKQRALEFEVDEGTMKQHGLAPQHIAALKQGPKQQPQAPQPQVQQQPRQATILPPQGQQKPKVEKHE